MAALLPAVRDRIKTLLSLDDGNVGVNDTGKPFPFAGEEFWQVHPGRFENKDEQTGRPAEQMIQFVGNVTVTLTRKLGYVPSDRVGTDTLLDPVVGMYKKIELLIGLSGVAGLHMDYLTLNLAGGTCAATGGPTWTGGQPYSISATQNGFYHPLVWVDTSQPIEKGPEWFWAKGQPTPTDKPSGVAIEIIFRDARRIVEVPQ